MLELSTLYSLHILARVLVFGVGCIASLFLGFSTGYKLGKDSNKVSKNKVSKNKFKTIPITKDKVKTCVNCKRIVGLSLFCSECKDKSEWVEMG